MDVLDTQPYQIALLPTRDMHNVPLMHKAQFCRVTHNEVRVSLYAIEVRIGVFMVKAKNGRHFALPPNGVPCYIEPGLYVLAHLDAMCFLPRMGSG